MNVDADLTAVDTSVPAAAPAPIADTPATPPAQQPSEPAKPSLREGIESSLRAIRERPRDEATGRFAPAAKQPATPAVAATPAVPTPAQPVAAVRPADMPKAWAADKAAYWAAMSPEQRTYVAERETQMEAFHAKHAGLAQWQQAAEQNGTTLHDVLQRVHDVENAMTQDPSQGLIRACQMVGLEGRDAVAALAGALRALGVQVGPTQGQQPAPTPQQPGQQPQPQSSAPSQEVLDMRRELEAIKGSLQGQEQAKAKAVVDAFAADPANKHWNAVAEDVTRELKAMRALGQTPDLKLAYERACWGRADIREQLVAEQVANKVPAAVTAKTQELEKSRSASRSVAGSPPVAEGRSSAEKPSQLRDQIAMSVRNVMGSRA